VRPPHGTPRVYLIGADWLGSAVGLRWRLHRCWGGDVPIRGATGEVTAVAGHQRHVNRGW